MKITSQLSEQTIVQHLSKIWILYLFMFHMGVSAVFSQTAKPIEKAVVLKYDTDVSTDGKKVTEKTHLILQINTPDAAEYCAFNFPYSKRYSIEELSASITDLNGNVIRKLSKKDIETTSFFNNINFYSDNFVKKFKLLHNQYPYLIDLTCVHEQNTVFHIESWGPVWKPEISTLEASLSFTFPKGYSFNKREKNIETPLHTEDKDNETLTWKSDYKAQKQLNILMPPLSELVPTVELSPVSFYYIKRGSFESWKSFGDWYSSIYERVDDLPGQEQSTIDYLTQGITDTVEIARILYHYLQDNNHYVSVNIKYGGMLPYPASYVCNNRFGDCKALSNYMKAMLKYKGIKSYIVAINAGEDAEETDPAFPAHQFNHVFVCLPVRNDTIWLECTSNEQPLKTCTTFTQNRYGLLVSPDGSKLVKTPAMTAEAARSTYCYKFGAPLDGTITVTSNSRLRGKAFEWLNGMDKQASDKNKENYIVHILPFKNIKVAQWKINLPDRDSTYIDLLASFTTNSPYSSLVSYTKIDHPFLPTPTFEAEKDRYYPVKINYPLVSTDTLIYTNDFKGMSIKDEPSITIDQAYGRFSITRELSDKTLIIVRKIEIPAQTVPLSSYHEFYAFCKQIKTAANSTILKNTNQ